MKSLKNLDKILKAKLFYIFQNAYICYSFITLIIIHHFIFNWFILILFRLIFVVFYTIFNFFSVFNCKHYFQFYLFIYLFIHLHLWIIFLCYPFFYPMINIVYCLLSYVWQHFISLTFCAGKFSLMALPIRLRRLLDFKGSRTFRFWFLLLWH